MLFRKDITDATGPLQLSAGQVAGAEEAMHAIQDIFAYKDTKAVFLIEIENAFNSINRRVMLHNLNFLCPIITTYTTNCYIKPPRLFIISEGEILSKEGTT